MSDRSVIVVGGGVVGVCCAYRLSRRGCRVTLIEAGEIACGASSGNAGLISPGHFPLPRPGLTLKVLRWMRDGRSPLLLVPRLDPNLVAWLWRFWRSCARRNLDENMRVLAALSADAIAMFEEIARDEHIDFALHRDGYMDVYATTSAFEAAQRDADFAARFGIDEEPIDGDEARRREATLSAAIVGAIWHPRGGFADPHAFVTRLADRITSQGNRVRTNAPVDSITTTSQGVRGVTLASGETIDADAVVLAAGPWTNRLAKPLGVNVLMESAKGYHVHIAQPSSPLRTAAVLGEAFVAATPMNGEIRLAGTLELSGLNHRLRRARVDMLPIQAARYLNDIDPATVSHEWCGLRPCSPDGLPYVGLVPRVPGLAIATGHAMMGFWMGPMTATLIEELLLDGCAHMDVAALRIDR